MDGLVKKAYDNWMHVMEYDGKSLLNFKQQKSPEASLPEVPLATQDYPNSFDQFTLPSLPVSVSAEQPTMDAGLSVGGTYIFGTDWSYSIILLTSPENLCFFSKCRCVF